MTTVHVRSYFSRENAVLFALSFLLIFSACEKKETELPSCDGIEWSYTGTEGPQEWEFLCTDYTTCGGERQSPVNISNATPDNSLGSIQTAYQETKLSLTNNGHTLQFTTDAGSTLQLDGQTYNLLQFHTHTHSEHTLDNQDFPMEFHFVHKNDATGDLAVIGVWVRSGNANPFVAGFVDQLPMEEGDVLVTSDRFTPDILFPDNLSYYSYEGSLTTPPCSEIVHWRVLKNSIELSTQQFAAFEALEHTNARPVQALNGRKVLVFEQ